jgi:hypothetical protein
VCRAGADARCVLAEASDLAVHVLAKRVEHVVEDDGEDLASGRDEARPCVSGTPSTHCAQMRRPRSTSVRRTPCTRAAVRSTDCAELLDEEIELGTVRVALVHPADVGACGGLGLA